MEFKFDIENLPEPAVRLDSYFCIDYYKNCSGG